MRTWAAWARRNRGRKTNLILDEDRPLIESLGSSRVARLRTWNEVIDDPLFGAATDHRLHVNLVPQPFVGDPLRASVVVLLLNPGLAPLNYFAEMTHKGFRQALWDNLTGARSKQRYPFLYLDPEWAWTGGYSWWTRKLSSVISEISREGNRLEAQRRLAKRLAAIELIPYHSKTSPRRLPKGQVLPSQELAMAFVHDRVLPRVRNGDTSLIVARQSGSWGFAKGEHDELMGLLVHGQHESRGSHMSINTRAGQLLLRALM